MDLTELGLDSGLAAQAQCADGLRLARVTAEDRNRYVVHNEQGEVPAELTIIGDRPRFQTQHRC